MAIGFLKWFDNDQAEESFVPLLPLPVTTILSLAQTDISFVEGTTISSRTSHSAKN